MVGLGVDVGPGGAGVFDGLVVLVGPGVYVGRGVLEGPGVLVGAGVGAFARLIKPLEPPPPLPVPPGPPQPIRN